jgi:hypothetical protein
MDSIDGVNPSFATQIADDTDVDGLADGSSTDIIDSMIHLVVMQGPITRTRAHQLNQ